MTKLLYIANIRFPTERAHGIQIAEMCNALAGEGLDVELVVQKRVNVLTDDVFTYYDIPHSFRITELRTLDTLQFNVGGILGRISYTMQTLLYSLNALRYVLSREGLIYSRDELPLFLLSLFGRPFVYEAHAPKWSFVARRVVRKARYVLPISRGLKNFYAERGIAEERMIVTPDAVNLKRFTLSECQEECRTRLSLPQGKHIVLYAGHLYKRKGAHLAAEAASKLSDDTAVVFVGGTEDEIPEFTERYGKDPHVLILGPKPYAEIPYYLRAADVLVLPNSAKDADARLYTSPMKLFEYMASGTPIVAADVPSLREILSDDTSYFFTPDDPEALARSLDHVVSHKDEGAGKAREALAKVAQYSWENRAKNTCRAIMTMTNPEK